MHVTHRIKGSPFRYEDPLRLFFLLFLFLFLFFRRIFQPDIRKWPATAAHLVDSSRRMACALGKLYTMQRSDLKKRPQSNILPHRRRQWQRKWGGEEEVNDSRLLTELACDCAIGLYDVTAELLKHEHVVETSYHTYDREMRRGRHITSFE